jgi:AhpD family alkylhydroperoxidase
MSERVENLKYFKEHYPELYKAYESFGKEIHEKGGPLDRKTRWLIKIAVSAASQYEYALQTHIEKALNAGCSREEIEHAVLLIAPTVGFPRMMNALMILRKTIG